MENKGALLIARQILDSDIWVKKPPEWLKVWLFILIRVNHTPTKQFPRGTNFFRWSDISPEIPLVSQNQFNECIRWLKRTKQITTQKTTRGNVITVVNYEKYQNFETYKTDTETNTPPKSQPTRNQNTPNTIKNNDNNETMKLGETPKDLSRKFFEDKDYRIQVVQELLAEGFTKELIKQELPEFKSHWTEPSGNGKKVKWELEDTFDAKRRLRKWLNNALKWAVKTHYAGAKAPDMENLTEKRLREEARIKSEIHLSEKEEAHRKLIEQQLSELRQKKEMP